MRNAENIKDQRDQPGPTPILHKDGHKLRHPQITLDFKDLYEF